MVGSFHKPSSSKSRPRSVAPRRQTAHWGAPAQAPAPSPGPSGDCTLTSCLRSPSWRFRARRGVVCSSCVPVRERGRKGKLNQAVVIVCPGGEQMDCWLGVDDTEYSSSRTSVEDEKSRTAQRHYGQRGTGQAVRVAHKIAQYGYLTRAMICTQDPSAP